ncbi:MAG TPA: hypothetical protein VGK21_07080 [Candidatus Angelobacter sp.]|jgi:hypothetical protein
MTKHKEHKEHKEHKTMTANPTFDLCAGATASAGSTTLTFTNNRPFACTIRGLGNLVDCGDSFSVPAKAHGVNGTKTCTILANAAAGTYPYSSHCCGDQTNPAIIMQ